MTLLTNKPKGDVQEPVDTELVHDNQRLIGNQPDCAGGCPDRPRYLARFLGPIASKN